MFRVLIHIDISNCLVWVTADELYGLLTNTDNMIDVVDYNL